MNTKTDADQLILAILMNQPLWPNLWEQDVAAAAFFLHQRAQRQICMTQALETFLESPVDSIRQLAEYGLGRSAKPREPDINAAQHNAATG